MAQHLSGTDASPPELRELVKWAVALLGQVIERNAGSRIFRFVESLREEMAGLRDQPETKIQASLDASLARLRALNAADRLHVARAFTLMLELMNRCENAYRSHRLAQEARGQRRQGAGANQTKFPLDAIIYVLTAHPTEARTPAGLAIFHAIQRTLIRTLNQDFARFRQEAQLLHELELAWRVTIVRDRSPRVKDEAEHIYSTLSAPETLNTLLAASQEVAPIYIRSWVGGDKDGHPGVDEKTMRESLALSRGYLLRFADNCLAQIRASLELLPSQAQPAGFPSLNQRFASLRILGAGDGRKVSALRRDLLRFQIDYRKQFGLVHPQLQRLRQLLHVFPALVVPLEFRESSDVLMEKPKHGSLAIDRMLRQLALISRGGDPRWYVRGFIVSMTAEAAHLRAAEKKVRAALGKATIPVIPLFETLASLEAAPAIMSEVLADPRIGKDIRNLWGGTAEIMVGYSDSAKESGALPSRLGIAQAMNELAALCEKEKIRPLFFQGSGGSVDRGGGNIQDQTAWWPHAALRTYKVTLQGEMVERSFSTPWITRSQIEKIASSASAGLTREARPPRSQALDAFAARIAAAYRATTTDPAFLKLVEAATPYAHLSNLKIGSRPVRRAAQLTVGALRAIPWVLCWTQSRAFFPAWWGVGTAWNASSAEEKKQLAAAFRDEPVFTSYARALGFTLAKVELPVWEMYLKASGLPPEEKARFASCFRKEYESAREFLRALSGEENPLWFRPWLGASIRLRSPMIHPLNLLQILAIESKDVRLFRHTVAGIASGVLTTG